MIKPIGGLDNNLLEGIIRTITSHKKVDRIILYGSRSGERFRRASDIDLAIEGTNWTEDDVAVVKFHLEESLPTALKIYNKVKEHYYPLLEEFRKEMERVIGKL